MFEVDPASIDKLLRSHGIVPQSITPIRTGKFNTSYTVEFEKIREFKGKSADKAVLRIAPPPETGFLFYEKNMMKQEPEIHRLIKEKTSLPVADIYVFDDSRSLIPNDYMIMEYLPGKSVADLYLRRSEYKSILEQTGKYLHQLHTCLQADQYGYLGEHHCMEPQSNWKLAFKIMWEKLIDDIFSCGIYSEKESLYARECLERHLRHFEFQDRASLLHMDIWSQNLLVDDSFTITGILDWDRALWGDPGIEFAVLDYVGFNQPAFWKGYGDQPEITAESQLRRIFYYLYEFQKYLVIWTLRRKGQSAKVQNYKSYSLKLLRQLG
jgi:aminoglycoside phosphotransferase (APT) family kinase protein